MANLYKEYVDKLWTNYAYAYGDFNNAWIDINAAWAFWNDPNDHSAIQRTLFALQHTLDGVECIIGRSYSPANVNYLDKALVAAWQYTEEKFPETTWESICEAWIKNNFEGRKWTIAFIDQMRKIIWDEPYDIRFAEEPTTFEISVE